MEAFIFAFVGALFGFWLAFVAASLGAWRLQTRLLSYLQKSRPETHARLQDPLWRTGVNQFELSAYLKSDRDEEDVTIRDLKSGCRNANRWIKTGIWGFCGLWALVALGKLFS